MEYFVLYEFSGVRGQISFFNYRTVCVVLFIYYAIKCALN